MDKETLMVELSKKKDYEDLGRGATDEEIRNVEGSLGVKLPKEYVDFLKRCGFVFWFGNSIFGVAPSDDDSVVHWTLAARSEPLPKSFKPRPLDGVVVQRYGGGGYYFLFSADSPRAGEVVLLLDELYGNESTELWENFWLFLESFV